MTPYALGAVAAQRTNLEPIAEITPPATPRSDGLSASSSPQAKTLRSRIAELKKEQTAAIQRKKEIAKDLRNSMRRNKRLREKVANLNDEDLVDVIRMREEKKREKAAEGNAAHREPIASGASGPSEPQAALSRAASQVNLTDRMADAP